MKAIYFSIGAMNSKFKEKKIVGERQEYLCYTNTRSMHNPKEVAQKVRKKKQIITKSISARQHKLTAPDQKTFIQSVKEIYI